MIEEKLKELGLVIPESPAPLASYVPAKIAGNMVFTSGQLPIENGTLNFMGKVGEDVSLEVAKKAAEISCLNCLSVIKSVIGSLDKVKQVVKIVVFVGSAPSFTDQPLVANGASDLLLKIFGDSGKHARSAVGVTALPKNACVEIEMIVEI